MWIGLGTASGIDVQKDGRNEVIEILDVIALRIGKIRNIEVFKEIGVSIVFIGSGRGSGGRRSGRSWVDDISRAHRDAIEVIVQCHISVILDIGSGRSNMVGTGTDIREAALEEFLGVGAIVFIVIILASFRILIGEVIGEVILSVGILPDGDAFLEIVLVDGSLEALVDIIVGAGCLGEQGSRIGGITSAEERNPWQEDGHDEGDEGEIPFVLTAVDGSLIGEEAF